MIPEDGLDLFLKIDGFCALRYSLLTLPSYYYYGFDSFVS